MSFIFLCQNELLSNFYLKGILIECDEQKEFHFANELLLLAIIQKVMPLSFSGIHCTLIGDRRPHKK